MKLTKSKIPLCVDLDGTLVFSDTLQENLIKLLLHKPEYIFVIPFWFLKGIAFLKHKIASEIELKYSLLPYNIKIIEYIKQKKRSGCKIYLSTGANEKIALGVSKYLKCFDDIFASNEILNNVGKTKAEILIKKFGYQKFDYIGNSNNDIPALQSSKKGLLVNANKKTIIKVNKNLNIKTTVQKKNITIYSVLNLLRIHQWVKNLLLFLPIIAAHQLHNLDNVANLIIAFFSFGFCASAIYIINDLYDLENDRIHEIKRKRPFANGSISILTGLILIPILLTGSLLIGYFINQSFFICLIIYIIITTFYTIFFKRVPVLDCATLSILYTFRIVAGGIVVNVNPSFWLLHFSVFMFLSLAFVKRYLELINSSSKNNSELLGRGYYKSDIPVVLGIGLTSGFASIVILSLYMQSQTISKLYQTPEIIWFSLIIVLIWISYIWLKACRNQIDSDPIIFALKDKISWFLGFLVVLIFLIATFVKVY